MDNDAYVTYHGNTEADREIAQRSVLFIDNETAARVLTMEDTVDAVEESYREWGLGRATATRATHSVPRPDGDGWYTWDPMASALPKMDALAVRMKSDILPASGTQVKKYCVAPGKFCGLILLFSTDDGAPLAIMNDGHIQHMRVGATAGVAANYMAREDATSVGMFGSGGMARTYLEAFAKVRKIDYCKVYSPTKAHREAYAAEMSDKLDINVIAVDSPDQVTEGTDIVAGCTDSAQPIIHPQYMAPGMHVTPVLPKELPRESVDKFDVVVRHNHGGAEGFFVGQDEEYAGLPAGHFDSSYRGVDRSNAPTLADLVSGKAPGRTSDDQLTCYYNVPGSGLQFAAVAYRTYELAKEAGLGRELPTEWFLEDERD